MIRYYDDLSKPLNAEQLTKMGYCRVSNAYHTVSRIDRKDWQQAMLDAGDNPCILLIDGAAADYYRRCHSKDRIELIPREIFVAVPTSCHNKTGYIQNDGTPHPGYKVVLVENPLRPR